MGDDIAVGVADETSRVVDRDTPDDERDALAERVGVDAEADAKVAHRPPRRRTPTSATSQTSEALPSRTCDDDLVDPERIARRRTP